MGTDTEKAGPTVDYLSESTEEVVKTTSETEATDSETEKVGWVESDLPTNGFALTKHAYRRKGLWA